MWYTIIIVVDLFLAWFITNGIISSISWAIGIDLSATLRSILALVPLVPEGFKTLILYVPNALLVGLYFMFCALPRSDTFKFWSGWAYMRDVHFAAKSYEMGSRGSVLTEVTPTWRPPHARGDGKQIVYAVCPHGIHAEVVVFCFTLNRMFDGVVTIATSLLFWIPILREFACLAGAMPANTATICSQLDHEKSIILLPEGLRGALHPNNTVGVLRGIQGENEPRKGFIRCALSSKNHRSLCIVPVYTKGADKLYSLYLPFPWLQKRLLSKFYYPLPLVSIGWYGTFWPKTGQIKVCYGLPIPLFNREVDDVHEEYCQAIEGLIKAAESLT
jgi:1-acyl-sn-glycerol-3-phosphate acyltransferase